MSKQLSVFLQNDKGRLTDMFNSLSEANINMSAFVLADTNSYGVARIICDKPDFAQEYLLSKGFRAMLTDIHIVKVQDKPGALVKLFDQMENMNINIEYSYCFAIENNEALVALKTSRDLKEIQSNSEYSFIDL